MCRNEAIGYILQYLFFMYLFFLVCTLETLPAHSPHRPAHINPNVTFLQFVYRYSLLVAELLGVDFVFTLLCLRVTFLNSFLRRRSQEMVNKKKWGKKGKSSESRFEASLLLCKYL